MALETPNWLRAQASIEALLVFLIFLSAFGIAYAAQSRLAASAQSRLDISLSQSSFSEFAAKLQSACAMGSGNVRTAEVKGKPATLSAEGNAVAFTSGSFSARANSSCQILAVPSAPSRAFYIENKEGMIEIT